MSKTILLVDDAETVLLYEKNILNEMGFELRTATDGAKAIQEVEAAAPDLILLDILMPEVDGIQTCRRLKENPDTQHIPIIIVTSRGEPEMVERAFQAGCDDYITKPLDKMELLSKVRTFLE